MTDNIMRKKNTGEPGNGGQFGSKSHGVADTTLPVPVPYVSAGTVYKVRSSTGTGARFNDQYVKVIRELGNHERIDEVGRMFEATSASGEAHQFCANELIDFERFDLESVRVSDEQWEKNGRMAPKKDSHYDQPS